MCIKSILVDGSDAVGENLSVFLDFAALLLSGYILQGTQRLAEDFSQEL
jgi:hypothetical protein